MMLVINLDSWYRNSREEAKTGLIRLKLPLLEHGVKASRKVKISESLKPLRSDKNNTIGSEKNM